MEMDGSLLIKLKRLTPLISIILRYSAVRVACSKFSALTQGNPTPLVLKSLGIKLAAIGRNKSVEPDSVSGEILKLGGEAMIPYLA
jgi:hypothetical protein